MESVILPSRLAAPLLVVAPLLGACLHDPRVEFQAANRPDSPAHECPHSRKQPRWIRPSSILRCRDAGRHLARASVSNRSRTASSPIPAAARLVLVNGVLPQRERNRPLKVRHGGAERRILVEDR